MKILKDPRTCIVYELTDHMPRITRVNSRLTARMLSLYGMYRNGLYDTRIDQELDADIAIFKPQFDYEFTDKSGKANNHLYHYASHVSIDAMQEAFKLKDGKCCVAYRNQNGRKQPVGFVVFYEKVIDAQKMVYISHLSVSELRQGIGTKLMQALMLHYPANTTFYLCARQRNVHALQTYEKLGYVYNTKYLKDFGYNPEYFTAMQHVTIANELKQMREGLESVNADHYHPFLVKQSSKTFNM